MGDMLVKAGDWHMAQTIYCHAQATRKYSSWPYRGVLEQRITDAERNVSMFRRPANEQRLSGGPSIMLQSPFACTACHQGASQ